MITQTYIVKITVDEDNIKELYPNYRFNWNTPQQFIDYLIDNLETHDSSNDSPNAHCISSLIAWGYSIQVVPRDEAKVLDLDLECDNNK